MDGNAQISKTMLGYEDHGILTCFLYLKSAGSGQAFGGYRLDAPDSDSILCGFWIKRILETVGVQKWEDLQGKFVRVSGNDYKIFGIGHITDNKWFYPNKEIDDKGRL